MTAVDRREPASSVSPETELILLLSDPSLTEQRVPRIADLVSRLLDWNRILGGLLLHRTAGIAWRNLANHGLCEFSTFGPSQLKKCLEMVYRGQQAVAAAQIRYTTRLTDEFDRQGIPYAVLKGSGTAALAYRDPGMRFFNDNDLLFEPRWLGQATAVLRDFGYVQGTWDATCKQVRKAARVDALSHSLQSHEVFPYMKAVIDEEAIDNHTVDVHFSLDLLTSNRTDAIVRDVLSRRVRVELGSEFWTLHPEDAFVFSCIHYQREAAQVNEVVKLKDLQLYKLADLLAFLGCRDTKFDVPRLMHRVERLSAAKEVYFSLAHLAELLPGKVAPDLLDILRPASLDYLHQLFDGARPVHVWQRGLVERFFDTYRLSEVT